jgi:hypothetical protein
MEFYVKEGGKKKGGDQVSSRICRKEKQGGHIVKFIY